MVVFQPQVYASLLGLASLTSQALAVPHTAPEAPSAIHARDEATGLVILDQYAIPGGNITVYGDDPDAVPAIFPSPDPASVQRRCGSNTVQCFNDHQGLTATCAAIIDTLRYDDTRLPTNPRSICMMNSSGRGCCISWANNVNNIVKRSLVPAAEKTWQICRGAGGNDPVSGKSHDTNLNGVCTTQCLSGRPDGCKA